MVRQGESGKVVELDRFLVFDQPGEELDVGGLRGRRDGVVANPLAQEIEELAEDLFLSEDVELIEMKTRTIHGFSSPGHFNHGA